jgi:predicted ATPase/DNA-binding CsgD family transcriptional regulator
LGGRDPADADWHQGTASHPSAERRVTQAAPIPIALTSFVGREKEVVEVRRLLGVTRLLTLTGSGGIGKTRLALEVGRTCEDIAFVDLAPESEGRLISALVAAALGIHEQPRVSFLDLLIANLASRSMLLILDNCEHVIAACSELVDQLLRSCGQLRILATSREPLAVYGERVWVVPPLSYGGSPDLPASGEAEQLFAERARLVQRDFTFDAQNAKGVTELCRHLDGIPLAIELAAARVRVLGVQGIAARLDERLRLLRTESQGVPLRHRTLVSAIEWSYDLLTPTEQAFLCRLSTFVGGWTASAAEMIWDSADNVPGEALDLLTHLVDKSLVQVEQLPDGDVRYRFLEMIREFALVRLRATDDMQPVCRRHAVYFLRFSEQVEPNLWGPAAEEWIRRLEQELDNARAALEWLITSHARRDAVTMGAAMGRFWLLCGRYTEGQQWILRILDLGSDPADPTLVRAKLLRAHASLSAFQGDFAAAKPLAEEALAITRQHGSEIETARSLLVLANTVQNHGDFAEARRLLEEAAATSRRAGGDVELVDALHYLGGNAFAAGNFARARAIADECLASAARAGYARGVARAEWVLGSIAYFERDLHAARLHLEASTDSSFELNAWWEAVQACVWLSHVVCDEGDFVRCASLLMQIRNLGQQLGDSEVSCLFLEGTVHFAAVSGQPELALRLAAAAEAHREAIGLVLFPVMSELVHHWLAPASRKLGRHRTKLLWAAGRGLSLPEALTEASKWNSSPGNRVRSDGVPLSRRELEVAALIARGRTNREIAQELVIAVSTAERHVANILQKLDLRSRTEIATAMMMRNP